MQYPCARLGRDVQTLTALVASERLPSYSGVGSVTISVWSEIHVLDPFRTIVESVGRDMSAGSLSKGAVNSAGADLDFGISRHVTRPAVGLSRFS
jgi:hypothetical protein